MQGIASCSFSLFFYASLQCVRKGGSEENQAHDGKNPNIIPLRKWCQSFRMMVVGPMLSNTWTSWQGGEIKNLFPLE